jgi:hypothetical protein
MTLKEFMSERYMVSCRDRAGTSFLAHHINQAACAVFEEEEPLEVKKEKLQDMFTALIHLNQCALDDLAEVTEP